LNAYYLIATTHSVTRHKKAGLPALRMTRA
jgi:hypothetical protein